MKFIDLHLGRIIATLIVIIAIPFTRYIMNKIVKNYSKLNSFSEGRTKMIIKTINILIILAAITFLISIWGVDTKNLLVALSSVFAVIGVAMFAQWSILSNITAGIIIYFTLKLKIGDTIKIHDKDFPIEAEVVDIKTFYLHLITSEGERIVYPNNLIIQKGISILK